MNNPKFTIILPTLKRPELAAQSIASVLKQNYSDWQLYVVVDDNVTDYTTVKKTYAEEARITFFQNPENIGKNKSLNKALYHLKENGFDGYIVYLDDDDWLSPKCLSDFAEAIKNNPNQNWFVSQRVSTSTKEPLTINKTGREVINYRYDMLLKRTFTGDTTHCIKFTITKDIRFPDLIKNAEEWIYFTHVSTLQKNFLYLPVAGTYSEGYAPDGLTDNYHNYNERLLNNKLILKEIWRRKIFSPYVLIYILGRLVKSFK